MPSKDQMNAPAWAWLSDRAKRRVTALRGTQGAGRQAAQNAAYVVSLARRAGLDPEALAKRIPADTLRRLKFPVLTHLNEDGTRSYKHDLGIVQGVKALLATDRGTDGATPAPTPRDESGRFTRQ